jgi:hypothetical protein
MKKRNVLNSPRLLALKKKRRKNLQNKILFLTFFFGMLFIGLVFLSRIDEFNIDTIIATGNKITDTELIDEVVNNNLEGYYFYLFPKSNFLLYPKSKIKNELASKLRGLKDISFVLENTKTLAVSLSERKAEYIWCGEDLSEINKKAEELLCYFIDNNGYLFDTAPYFSGDVYFKFFGLLSYDEINTSNSPLGGFFSPLIFKKIVSLKEVLSSMQIKPTSLYLKPDGDIEIYLSSNKLPPNAPKIILKSDFVLEKLFENLQAALTTEPLKSGFKNKYSSLLYIDLRFGNKIYFKFE